MLLVWWQVLSLESKCQDFQVNITALREEISERESVIAQNYTTIQLLRRRLADMEKHKFVLGYRTQVQHLHFSMINHSSLQPCNSLHTIHQTSKVKHNMWNLLETLAASLVLAGPRELLAKPILVASFVLSAVAAASKALLKAGFCFSLGNCCCRCCSVVS